MAGLFGMFDPTREGPGVSKNAPEKKRFFLFFELYFRKFTKIMVFNLLYVLCCIPIITIGPANAAITYCMRNIAREEYVDSSDFFEQFKKNFWQALVIWIFQVIISVAIAYGLIFYSALMKNDSFFGFIGFGLCIISAIIVIFMSYYVNMIIVTFKVTFKQLLKDSFIFAFVGLGRNIITSLILLVIVGWFAIYLIIPTIAPLFNPQFPASISAASLALSLYIFFIPALCSFIISFNAYPNVKKFMIDPTLAKMYKENKQDEAVFEDAE